MIFAGVDDVLQESLERANKLLSGAANGPGLRKLLEQADADLKAKLGAVQKAYGVKMKCTEASLQSYAAQTSVVLDYTKQRLLGYTHTKALAAVQQTVKTAAADLQKLDTAFTGVVTPLRLREAAQLAGVATLSFKPLLSQHKTSVDRYGEAMTGEIRKILRRGIMVGATNGELTEALVGHGGPKGKVSLAARVDPVTGKVVRLVEADIPEGLFKRKKYWAQRIVRTEVAHAQNEARLQTIRAARMDFPDMGKKILATFDARTAMDSIGVHGQIRKPDELFMDGAGRQYLRPPARPNDRETIIPWRLSWKDTPYSEPVPAATVAQMQAASVPAGPEHALKVQQAAEKAAASVKTEGQDALARVKALIAQKTQQLQAKPVGPSSVELQAATMKAKAAQAVAQAQAKLTLETALQATTVQVQQHVLAQSKAVAKKAGAAEAALAKAAAYKAKVQAEKALAAAQALQKKATEHVAAIQAAKAAGAPDALQFATLKALAKAEPQTVLAMYQQLGLSKGGKVATKLYSATTTKIGEKLGIYEKPKPKPAEPETVYVKPDRAFILEGKYTHKVHSGGPGGYDWLDVHGADGEKKAFVLSNANEWAVKPPPQLVDKGWKPMAWVKPEHGGTSDGLNAATHYALQVSTALQGEKIAAAKLLEAKQEEEAKAARAARGTREPTWSKKWKGPHRPLIEGEDPAEGTRKRWSDGRAGVGVHADGDAIEDLAVQLHQEVINGKAQLVVRFKLTAPAAEQQLSGGFAEGETSRHTRFYFQAQDMKKERIEKETGGAKMEAPGISSVLERKFGKATVTIARGSDTASTAAMHNAVEVRMPMPKGDKWKAFAELADKMGLDVSAPSGLALRTAKRARILVQLSTEGGAELARASRQAAKLRQRLGGDEVDRLWEAHATPAMREVEADAKMREVSPGRASFYSETLAKRLREAGVTRLIHHGGDDDVFEQILAIDKQGSGLLSSRERWSRGAFTQGMSSSRDFETGGADSFFLRINTKVAKLGQNTWEVDPSELGRLDWYHYNEDTYGNVGDSHRSDRSDLKKLERMAGSETFGGGNELMSRHSVPLASIRRLTVSRGSRDRMLKRLAAHGVDEINGIPVGEFFEVND